ncbi:hypothetical protein C6M98_01455 [Corynebacterium diphtheriae]|nr:hypothetical protein A6J36_12050 [Corynebacterium diphtheriae]PTN67163.1 hypothetical protein C6M98_01455 [Corynebacterium diphtheriae]
MHRETPHNLVSDFSVRIMGSSSLQSLGGFFYDLPNYGIGDRLRQRSLNDFKFHRRPSVSH